MKLNSSLIFLLVLLSSFQLNAQNLPPIGQWRDHLPYHQAIDVINSAEKIWCATPYSLFSIDPEDNSIERWSRINGLSETGLSTFGIEDNTGKIVIAYNSSNIDVLYRNDVFNINDISISNINADKSINHVFVDNGRAYLSAGLGIFVIDLDKYEVKETYVIGNSGNYSKVFELTVSGGNFYAATQEGLKKASASSPTLPDFRSWQMVSGSNGLPSGIAQNVTGFQSRILVTHNDSVFISNGNNFNFFYTGGWSIKNLGISGDKIMVSETNNNAGRVVVLTASGSVERIIQNNQFTSLPLQSIYVKNEYWIADSIAGLSKFTGNSFQSLNPDSPEGIATADMSITAGKLWIASGGVNTNWQPLNNKKGLYSFSENTWSNFNARNFPAFDSLNDMLAIAIDPRDENIWAGSFGGGLLNRKPDNSLTIFKQNSAIQPAYFLAGSYRVSGLVFDQENNLWIANYGANQPLVLRKPDGSWRSFSIPYPLAENAVSKIIIDDLNQKWIISPKGNGLLCFNHGQSVDNTGDDKWKWYRSGTGNGNLPDNNVLSIAKDKTGFIWIGTNRGVGIIQCPQEVFNAPGCEAVLPIVQQDNFAGYLFRDEVVQALAVDGADRKWIGTKNGVWLISSTGEKTIYRFSESNSPLLSNDVNAIAIDDKTGEVFFSTAKGICSFRGTATEGESVNSNVLVFPNPVPPAYTGTIGIRGLAANSIVKITEMNGRLIYQTRALGGQAVWNGKDYRGRKISTGVYLVLVSDDGRNEKMVTKIVFINR